MSEEKELIFSDHMEKERRELAEIIDRETGAKELADALEEIANQEDYEMALDPQWAKRIARAALAKFNGAKS